MSRVYVVAVIGMFLEALSTLHRAALGDVAGFVVGLVSVAFLGGVCWFVGRELPA